MNISSGTAWEDSIGYSRDVKVGNQVFVAGTTAIDENGAVVAPGDPYLQAQYIFQKIAKALQQAGAGMEQVVRTRIFVTDIAEWEAIGKAHGEVFRQIKPAATMVAVKGLIAPGLLVEIEADAVII